MATAAITADTAETTPEAAIAHFRAALSAGRHWYLALLDAVGRWTLPEEIYEGRRYCYLIEGEAFDWLLLAERLCCAAVDALPAEEVEALLFHGEPPLDVSEEEFRQRIGPMKAWAYLNYFYGVTVEESLLLVIEEALWKEQRYRSSTAGAARVAAQAFERLYGEDRARLLSRFQQEKGYSQTDSLGFQEWKEFTYWLFRQRVKSFNKPGVASDTKRALEALFRHRTTALKVTRARPTPAPSYADPLEVSARRA